jgi:hypothetical protein
MSEMDPREARIDGLLRRSMSTAPVPRLSSDFEPSLSRELQRRSRPPSPYGRILLVSYGVISFAMSIYVMRSQGLGWAMIAAMTLGPLAMVAALRRLRGQPSVAPSYPWQ